MKPFMSGLIGLAMLISMPLMTKAQQAKIKIKKGVAYVDDKPSLHIEDCMFSGTTKFRDYQTEKVLFEVRRRSYRHHQHQSPANPQGNVHYSEISFPQLGLKCEVRPVTDRGFLKLIAKYDLLENDVFVQNFVYEVGQSYTQDQQRLEIMAIR